MPTNPTGYMKEYFRINHFYYVEKVKCECGVVINRYYMYKHRKSKKHQLLLTARTSPNNPTVQDLTPIISEERKSNVNIKLMNALKIIVMKLNEEKKNCLKSLISYCCRSHTTCKISNHNIE